LSKLCYQRKTTNKIEKKLHSRRRALSFLGRKTICYQQLTLSTGGKTEGLRERVKGEGGKVIGGRVQAPDSRRMWLSFRFLSLSENHLKSATNPSAKYKKKC